MLRKEAYIGQQVFYVPGHAISLNDNCVQDGFIVSIQKESAMVRYFRNHSSNELRTVANSESTRFANLLKMTPKDNRFRPERLIDKYLSELGTFSVKERVDEIPAKEKVFTDDDIKAINSALDLIEAINAMKESTGLEVWVEVNKYPDKYFCSLNELHKYKDEKTGQERTIVKSLDDLVQLLWHII